MSVWQSGAEISCYVMSQLATDSEIVATISRTMIFTSKSSNHNKNYYNGKTVTATTGAGEPRAVTTWT